VEKRQVIDGQQRLTTLQIFLAAFRDFCQEQGCQDLAKECDTYTLNKGMMADPETDKYKVWPTLLDRKQFTDVISAGSRNELIKIYPLVYKKYARKPQPRPKMIEAYLFFYDELKDFYIGSETDEPLAAAIPIAQRLEECFQTLKNSLQVVAIDLAQGDDAQVIFETLNARGEPLLPADLLRNFIFLRAARKGEPQEPLYKEFWQRFEEPFWHVAVQQGRLLRPRSDLFMQHFLASRQEVDIPIKHLYMEYKFWIERTQPFSTVRDELSTLARQGDDFRRIVAPDRNDPIYPFATFLENFDMRTSYPFILMVLDSKVDDELLTTMAITIESYLVRRAVCGLTTKNYNRIFLSLTRNLKRDGVTQENLVKQLSEQTGDSGLWPSDDAFMEAWYTRHAYETLNNSKIVHLLKRLNETYVDGKMEELNIDCDLTVEHIMPQQWIENWPLPDGSKGMTYIELFNADKTDPRVKATMERTAALHTIGNLTILTQPLNSAVKNYAWGKKKPELLRYSLLPINQQLHAVDVWDETAIATRCEDLLQRALKLWPR